MKELMDPNWLATTVDVVITLFIFLLGVPALIFQTFVPAELRKIFNERIGKKHLHILVLFAAAILNFLVLLGNYGIYYILQQLIPSHYELIINFWYLLSLLFMLGIFIFSVRAFLRQLAYFSGGFGNHINPLKDILSTIQDSICNNYDKFGNILQKDLEDLITLSKYCEKGLNTQYLLEAMSGIYKQILHSDTQSYYGNNLKSLGLFEPLQIGITDYKESSDSENIYTALEIFSFITLHIFGRLRKELQNYSQEIERLYFSDLSTSAHITLQIGSIALEKKDYQNVKKALSNLTEVAEKINFLISHHPIDQYNKPLKKVKRDVTIQFYYLTKEIIQTREYRLIPTILQKLNLSLFRRAEWPFLFALVAIASSLNEVAKEDVKRRFRTLKIRAKKAELKKAETYFLSLGEYDTVREIRQFMAKT